ncbi:hypothetical protein ACQJBY_073432 [Aegilops geniculata]
MFLAVPQEMLSGDTLMLSVWIDLAPPSAGAPNKVNYTTGQDIKEDAINFDDPDYIEFTEGPKGPLKANWEKHNEDKDDNKEHEKEEEEDDDEEEDGKEEVEEDDDNQPMVRAKRPRRDNVPEGASKKKKD